MTNIVLWVATTLLYWFVSLLAKPTVEKRKRLALFAVLCLPINISGYVFTVLGNVVGAKGAYSVASLYQRAEKGNAITLVSLYQDAGELALTGVGLPGYQQAGGSATVIIGAPLYQNADNGDVSNIFGVSFYQQARHDAGTAIGVSFYQHSLTADAAVFFGASFYQKAARNSSVAIGMSFFQRAGNDALTLLGFSGYKNADRHAFTFFGLSLYQKAKEDSGVGLGVSVFDKAGNRVYSSIGLSFYQSGGNAVRMFVGLALYQSVDCGAKTRTFGAITTLRKDN